MTADIIPVTLTRHEVLSLQHLLSAARTRGHGLSDALELIDNKLYDAITKADADKLAKVEFTAFWEANQHLQMGEAKALFAGKKLAFRVNSAIPLRRGDEVRMRSGFVLGGAHVKLTFAYMTDDGQIATQETGEPVLCWDADDLIDVKMVGRPASHVDRFAPGSDHRIAY